MNLSHLTYSHRLFTLDAGGGGLVTEAEKILCDINQLSHCADVHVNGVLHKMYPMNDAAGNLEGNLEGKYETYYY